jgi:D-alanyl-D-alanine carboxypeptidase
MKSIKFHIVSAVAALAVVLTVVTSGGQSERTRKSSIKPTVRITSSRGSAEPNRSAPLTEAATKNAALKNDLIWMFGGKQQRGWYLYDLLIEKTLNTPDDSGLNEFADALTSWQKKSQLMQTGVLDEPSLVAMVSQWQSDRLKNRAYAEPNQLLIAPSTDFYDPERTEELRQVERNTYAAYKRMAAAADRDLKLSRGDKYLKIVSAFRSRDYQDQLRRQSPNSGPAGLAVNSPHFTGRALDLYVGGSPVDTNDANRAIQVKTPAYKWLVQNAARFGFRPYFYEPWHWEYVQ